MAGLNVSISEIKSAISNQNTQVTAGSLGALPTDDPQALQLTLKTNGRLSDVKEFENIIIRSNMDGSNIRLKDVARVELGAQSYSNLGLVNGKPSAIIMVSQLPDANIINMSKAVHAKVDELNSRLTNGIKILTIKDDADYIKESMHEVEFTILLTALIVVLIIFLFLGDGMATLVPCATIPVSLVGTFFALQALGMSINLLSLFALVLAVGVVVDDAIVVIENVKRHLDEGKSAIIATQLTMEEVGPSLVAMALVLMAVFVPIGFMGGMTGVMYKQFAVCIAVSIAISAICALTLSPAMCSHFLGQQTEDKPAKTPLMAHLKHIQSRIAKRTDVIVKKFNDGFNKVEEFYMEYVRKFVYDKKLLITFYLVIVALTLISFKTISTGFIPDEDQGVLLASITLPDGASLSRTEKSQLNLLTKLKS